MRKEWICCARHVGAMIFDKHAASRRHCNWYTSDIRRSKRSCQNLERRLRRARARGTTTAQLETDYFMAMKTHKCLIKSARKEYTNKMLAQHRNNPKALFETFAKLAPPKAPHVPSILSTDDFAYHFFNKPQPVRKSIPELPPVDVLFPQPNTIEYSPQQLSKKPRWF